MKTPIVDFARAYKSAGMLRLHMPGHKGKSIIGPESLDITEIDGADSLYDAVGIIRESEENASTHFGCPTFYSTEGSSLSIRAMLYLLTLYAAERGHATRVLAARNCHKSFVSGAAMLDIEVEWLMGKSDGEGYLSCAVDAEYLGEALDDAKEPYDAVFLTSPDYLGGMSDISALAEVCHSRGVLLLVDCAHGSYLRFLSSSLFPIDLGADICVSSAHKTLPVLTGGGYLHISPSADRMFVENAKAALALFGTTSPSYLILESLDAANGLIADGYDMAIEAYAHKVAAARERLIAGGLNIVGDEPMKITVAAKKHGYTGYEFAAELDACGICAEFADPDHVVFMPAPSLGATGLCVLESELSIVPRRPEICTRPPLLTLPPKAMSMRRAIMSPRERVAVKAAVGRVLADVSVGCPPAVPIAVAGEVITDAAAEMFDYYGVKDCLVVKQMP